MRRKRKIVLWVGGVFTLVILIVVFFVAKLIAQSKPGARFERWSMISLNETISLGEHGGLVTGDGRFWAVSFEYSGDELELELVNVGYSKIEGFKEQVGWSRKISGGASIPAEITNDWLVYRIEETDGEKLFFVNKEVHQGIFVENSW